MADVVEEVPAKEEEVESGDDDESDADSIPELEETEAGAGGEFKRISPQCGNHFQISLHH